MKQQDTQRQTQRRGLVVLLLWLLLTMTTATAQVTTLDDAGAGSLRAEIAAANSGDTITFQAGLNGTINLSSEIAITQNDLTIDAAGATITIDGQDTSRIFAHTVFNGTLTVNNLTIQNGNTGTGDGGGIYSNGAVTVTNSTISGNTASSRGGGIYSRGAVTVTTSTISNNTTSGGDGGGIYSIGAVTVTNSTISGNTASSRGGGIYSRGAVTVTDSTISGNSATGNGGGIFSNDAVTVINSTISGNSADDGGGIFSFDAVTITDSTISGNTAGGSGGGIFSNDAVTVTNSTISDNTAGDGGGILSNGAVTVTDSTISGNSATGNGGGIFIFSNDAVTVINSTISGNEADFDGGGIISNGAVTVTNSTISDNTAGGPGGGIRGANDLTLNGCTTIENNTAGGAGDQWNVAGIVTDGTTLATSRDTPYSGSTCGGTPQTINFGPLAAKTYGDAPFTVSATGGASGQPVTFTSATPTICTTGGANGETITLIAAGTCTINADQAGGESGGVTYAAAPQVPQGFTVNPAAASTTVNTTDDTTDGSCDVVHCSLRDAIATATDDDTITFDTSLAGQTITLGSTLNIAVADLTIDAKGLASPVTIAGNDTFRIFDHTGTGTLTVNNLTIQNGNAGTGDGGGIYSNGAVTVTDSTISGNVSDDDGGGIYSEGNVTVTNGTISGNSGTSSGGGIYSEGNVTVTNSTISDNEAFTFDGSGIFGEGNVTITNSTISGNSGLAFGGGIHSNGNVTVTDSTISGNGAEDGGGIYSEGNVTVTNSTISGNDVEFDGGGILSRGAVTITNSTISGNFTEGNNGGGGIYSEGNVTVTNSTISGNDTRFRVADGGGISGLDDLTLNGCTTIESNTATGAGDQWNVAGTVTDNNNLIAAPVPTTYDDAYVGCPTRVINPDPDMQIRAGATTAAASITSGSVVNIGAFNRGEVATVDFLVRNPGAQVLEIGELGLPSFLSVAGEPLPETLDSFASALLTLEVNTSAAGALEGEFSLASNDPDANENPFVFTVKGSVSDTPANVLNILPGVDLGDISTATGEDDVVLLSFKLLVPAGSTSVTVDSLTLAASNAGIERASNLKLYIDGGTRGELDARDVFVASTDDTEALTFSFPARTFSPNVPMWFIVVGDF